MPDVFISYSRRDKDFVARLNGGLEQRGKDAWVDWEDIPPSAEWFREIQDGIDRTDAFLLVLSPDSVASEVCARELDHALERRKRILPILHREVDPARVRPEAAALNWVYLRDEDPFDTGIDTLVTALDTDLEHVRAHTELAELAIAWDRAGRDRSRLLRGSELEESELWLTAAAGKEPGPTELQAVFVQASRDAARRRRRLFSAAVSVALVVAVALAIVALVQRSNAVHQSHIAFARQLDAQAQSQYETDPELSVLLAVRAARVAPGGETQEALRQALGRSHVRERYRSHDGGAVHAAMWSPRGDRLAVADTDGHVRVYRPGTRARPLVLAAPGLYNQVAWDARGKRIVTGGGEPAVWNAVTGRRVRALAASGAPGALAVALSPDGRRVATVDLRGAGHVWDVHSGRELARFPRRDGPDVSCLLWSPDGSTLAECGVRGLRTESPTSILRLLDTRTGRQRRAIHLASVLVQATFSPDGRRIAGVTPGGRTQTASGTLIFDVRSGRLVRAFPETGSAAAFSPDGARFAYGTAGGPAYVYTLGTDLPPRALVGHTGRVQSIRFSSSGAYVVTGSTDGTARVFNAYSGEQLEVLAGHGAAISDAGFSADETRIATAGDDGTARVWTSPKPRPVHQAPVGNPNPHLVFAPGGRLVAAVGTGARSGTILDGHTLRRVARIAAPAGEAFVASGWSPDGRWIGALAGRTDAARKHVSSDVFVVYDAHSGRPRATVRTPGAAVVAGAFGGPGDRVATANAAGEVDQWDPGSGRRLARYRAAGQPVDVVFSADGSLLALAHADDTVDVWRLSDGRRLHLLHGPAPVSVNPIKRVLTPITAAFSPDGRTLAVVGADPSVQLWDVASGRLVRRLRAGGATFDSVAFGAGGGTLVAGGSATAHIWRLPSGDHVRELPHASPSTFGIPAPPFGVKVGVTRDGSTISTSGDFDLKAWEASTGQELFEDVPAPQGGDLSPDGHTLAVAVDGVARLYPCELCGGLDRLLATAARVTTRGFTRAERATYLREG